MSALWVTCRRGKSAPPYSKSAETTKKGKLSKDLLEGIYTVTLQSAVLAYVLSRKMAFVAIREGSSSTLNVPKELLNEKMRRCLTLSAVPECLYH